MNKKRTGIAIGCIVIAAAVAGGIWFYGKNGGVGNKNNSDTVYVQSVSSILQMNSGVANRFSGVVEPQDTWEVNQDTSRKILEVYVEEGDEVSEGTPLFVYDTSDLKLEQQQAQLEIENINNQITTYNEQIATLTSERDKATTDDAKFDYTTQIQTVQTSIRQSQFELESKKASIEKVKKSINDATITSKIAGVVKQINDTGTDEYGNSSAYMTILATGEYQIKGTINEQNMGEISEGAAVIAHSRVDDTLTWRGTITKVDTESAQENGNSSNMYYGGGSADSMQQSTSYPFYVTLDSIDGLMLGQHVYLEMDYGQQEQKEGIWLYSGYLVLDEETAYVWAKNDADTLEKREITLGSYDAASDEYEIVSGLAESDYIAFPMTGLYEGVTAVTNESEVDYTAPLYNQMDSNTEVMDDMGVYPDTEVMDDMARDVNSKADENMEVSP